MKNIFFNRKFIAIILSIAFTGLMFPTISKLPLGYIFIAVSYLLLFNFCISYAATFLRRISFILIPILLFLSTIAAYFFATYRIKINHELIFLLLETNTGEAGEFINPELVTVGLTGLLFSLLMGYLIKNCTGKIQFKLVIIPLLALIPMNIGLSKFRHNPRVRILRPAVATKYAFPYCVVNSFANFTKHYIAYKTQGEVTSSALLESSATLQSEPLKLIFIIGESARADRFQLNGYKRATNPLLMKEKNVITFGAIKSFSAYTRISVPAMITPTIFSKPEVSTGSFLALFKKHGFETTWLSANDRFTGKDTPTTRAIGEVENKLFRNRFTNASYGEFTDDMFLEPVKSLLTDENKNQAIAIHTRGSHAHYAARYTKLYQKFMPDNYGSEMNIEKVNNAYDNSILFTDAFIKSIIDLVRDENAVVIYSSDHGESLGENGRFSHGDPKVKEQREVPLIIWYSDKYEELNPKIVALLKEQVGKKLSHDVLFPWTVNLGGISLINTDQPVLVPAS